MKYVLKRAVLGCDASIEITSDDFHAILDAREVLSSALTIEEKYLVLLSNYEELERELVSQSVSATIRPPQKYVDFHSTTGIFNTRMVNVLTACRLYIDHLCHHIKDIDQDSSEAVKRLSSSQYDDHFEYRFMEALRNYVQHRGFPVHKTSYRFYLTEPVTEESHHVKVLEIFTQRKMLEADGQFKASVLKEMDDEVNLKHAVRRYIECLSRIHIEVRGIIHQRTTQARELMEFHFNQYKERFDGQTLGLAVVEINKAGDYNEKVPLTLEWDNVRLDLIGRNRILSNLSRTHVSGE